MPPLREKVDIEQSYKTSHRNMICVNYKWNVAGFLAILASKSDTLKVAHTQIGKSFAKLWSDATCEARGVPFAKLLKQAFS